MGHHAVLSVAGFNKLTGRMFLIMSLDGSHSTNKWLKNCNKADWWLNLLAPSGNKFHFYSHFHSLACRFSGQQWSMLGLAWWSAGFRGVHHGVTAFTPPLHLRNTPQQKPKSTWRCERQQKQRAYCPCTRARPPQSPTRSFFLGSPEWASVNGVL